METAGFRRTRRMILTRVLLVPFVTVMLVCGTLVYFFAVNLREQVASELVRIADGHRQLIEQFLKERVFDLRFTATSYTFEQLSEEGDLEKILNRLQLESRALLDLGLFDEKGNHVAYAGPYDLRGKNYAEAEWFRAVQKKGVYISDVFLGYRNIPHFVIAVRRDEGDRTWYLRATIDTLYFNDLAENIRVGKTGEAYLINLDGVFQTRCRSGGALMEFDPDRSLYQIEEKNVVPFAATDQFGERHLYATGSLRETGWTLVVRQEIGDAYAPLIRAVIIAVALIVGGGAIVVIMAFVLASSLANRLSMAALEKREMKTQLIMAGKLAEVGEMSAGVAHEINNPLQVIKSEQTMINDILAEIEDGNGTINEENKHLLDDSVEQIGIQIDRCKQITQGLLKFARKTESANESIDLKPFIQEVVGMIEHKAELENIRVVQQFEDEIPPIITDSGQLQQVFLNLLNNAIDALKGRSSGEIRIAVEQKDGSIVISVADNGCGVAPDQMEKIFLPFYTTKPVGQGTGLGLSTCYGIVENMDGKISVSSELNSGTVFTVWLPLEGSHNVEKNGGQFSRKEERKNEQYKPVTG